MQVTHDPAIDLHPVFSPDGRQLAFVSDREGGRQVWVMPMSDDHAAGPARRVTSASVGAGFPAWSPDGSQLAWVADAGGYSDVWVLDPSGQGQPSQATRGIFVHRVAWDPSGDALLVSGSTAGSGVGLWRSPFDGGGLQEIELEPGFGYDGWGAFGVSGNGRVLAYVTTERVGDLWALEVKPGRL